MFSTYDVREEISMFFSRKDPLPLQDWYVSLPVPTVGFCRNYYTYLHSTGVPGNFSCKGQNIVFLPRNGVLKPVEKSFMKKSRRRQSAYPDRIREAPLGRMNDSVGT